LVIGAGESGLPPASGLERDPHTIIEKNAGVGGTW
jgi:cation diffusion facilitator CzcD-associated flavoprotein CzcO